MKRIYSLLMAIVVSVAIMAAQVPASINNMMSDAEHDFLTNILPYWQHHSVDPKGGFYGTVRADGQAEPESDKGSILNARILWMLSNAYRLYGDTASLRLADRAADYYTKHFIGPDGRVWWSVDAEGKPSDESVQTYAVCYGIYGLSAHYAATGNQRSLAAAKRLYRFVEQRLHDPQGGYYERLGNDKKMHNPHIHVLESYTALAHLWPDAGLKENLREVLTILTEETYAVEPVDYGHQMEMSWMMTEAADLLGDAALINCVHARALKLVDVAMKQERLSREWWPACETVLGTINAWQLTGEQRYLDAAISGWMRIKDNFIDKENGEWHKLLPREGRPGSPKVSVWFGPYHNSRVAFELHKRFAPAFALCKGEYFRSEGTDMMAFSDFYPEGHQGGISLIINSKRIFSNGDIRLEPTPGQWQPVPKQLSRKVSEDAIVTRLCYPDSSRHMTGFNPMFYPEMQLQYEVSLRPEGKGFVVTVNLDQPIPAELVGRAGFNLEIFPGEAFGRPWLMDNQSGIYPQQPNAPVLEQKSYLDVSQGNYKPVGKPEADLKHLRAEGYSPVSADEIIAAPYAVGRVFTSCPDDLSHRFRVESRTADLKLYDGRMNHNNGWFVLRSEIPAGATTNAVEWYIEPAVTEGWMYEPVVQVSQVGYHPNQSKMAVIERDSRVTELLPTRLVKLTDKGEQVVGDLMVNEWNGQFLRYRYAIADFSELKEPGLYRIDYGTSRSTIFRIGEDVFDRGVWQPVIEYFLPVQMCHMRVNEKYRVWHDFCHMDDALMAQPGNHIDGYDQMSDNHTHFQPGDKVPGLNVGGWHDAGDFDLRVESQAGECYILAMVYEQFRPEIDATDINQQTHVVEIHQPDGKNDILQQIEHGALSVVGGYKALGRLYCGIICNNLRQYVLLGDASAMTDGVSGNADDRWVYTEINPSRELTTAAHLAATSRVLRDFNPELSAECLLVARALFDSIAAEGRFVQNKLQAAAELFITTREQPYLDYILSAESAIMGSEKSIFNDQLTFSTTNLSTLARVEPLLRGSKDKRVKRWMKVYRAALELYSRQLAETVKKTPYGVPYEPSIWGAGWDIQRFGFENYFLAAAYPDLFPKDPIYNALAFILGCHPGTNRRSFAGGVGAESTTVGYGLNRADWSYIPGGVVSGTALIRPDFPELLVFPYLWQQVEYVLGGGSSNYMFLVLAAKTLANE